MEAIAAPAIGAPRPIVQKRWIRSGAWATLLHCGHLGLAVQIGRAASAENAVRAADRRGSTGVIHEMSVDNPLWGAPRIQGELLMLGFVNCWRGPHDQRIIHSASPYRDRYFRHTDGAPKSERGNRVTDQLRTARIRFASRPGDIPISVLRSGGRIFRFVNKCWPARASLSRI